MPRIFPPPKLTPISGLGGLVSEFFYSWVVAISGLTDIPEFTTPTLDNGWLASAGREPGFYRDGFDIVRLRGAVNGGTIGLTALTLPPGFIPEQRMNFPIVSASAFGFVRVDTDGTVTPVVGSASGVNLDGISFRVPQT